MFQDNELSFATAMTLNGFAVATTPFTNVIDTAPLGGQNTPNVNTGRNIGAGDEFWLYVLFTVAPTSGGGATIDLQLVTSAAAALTSPTLLIDITGGALAYNGAGFAVGKAYKFALPRATYLRYLGINAIVATAALTGGVVTAFLTRYIQDADLYAAGFLVA